MTNSQTIDAEEIRIEQKKGEARFYRGVQYDKSHDRFRARLDTGREKFRATRTKTAEEAARLYDEMAKAHLGDRAVLNFPKDA